MESVDCIVYVVQLSGFGDDDELFVYSTLGKAMKKMEEIAGERGGKVENTTVFIEGEPIAWLHEKEIL